MKRFVISAVMALMMASAAFAGQAEAATTLRLGHVVADNSSLDKGLDYFAKLVSDKSGGELKIQVFPNSSLGDNTAMMEQLQFGSLDMMAPSVAALSGFTPSTAIFDLPYLFKNEAAAEEVLDGPLGDTVGKALEPQGFDLPHVRAHGIYGKNVHISVVNAKIKGYLPVGRPHDGKTFHFRFGKKASKRQRRPCDIFIAIAIHRAVLVGRQGNKLRQSQQISCAGFLASFARRNHFDETGRVQNHARSPEDVLKTVPCGLLFKAHAKRKQRVQIETLVKETNLFVERLNVGFQRRVPADPKGRLQSVDGGSVPGRDLPRSKTKIF